MKTKHQNNIHLASRLLSGGGVHLLRRGRRLPAALLASALLGLSLPGSLPASILIPSDGAAGDDFGFSVSQSGSVGLVGAWGDEDNGRASGWGDLLRKFGTATGN